MLFAHLKSILNWAPTSAAQPALRVRSATSAMGPEATDWSGHSLIMMQRLAIANGYGWTRFLHMIDQVMPRRGDTLPLPLPEPEMKEAAN